MIKKLFNFSDLIEMLPGHVYWKDKTGKYLGCNKAQAKSLGLEVPENIVGKTDFDFSPKKYELMSGQPYFTYFSRIFSIRKNQNGK